MYVAFLVTCDLSYKILFCRSWYKEAGISFLLDFRSSRAAVVSHIIELIQMFQVCATIVHVYTLYFMYKYTIYFLYWIFINFEWILTVMMGNLQIRPVLSILNFSDIDTV